MEKENQEQKPIESSNNEYDKFGNAVIGGKTYFSEESVNKFQQSLQSENQNLKNQIDTLTQQFNILQEKINTQDRTKILQNLGIKEDQIDNVLKLTNDIPNQELEVYINQNKTFDVFKTTKIKPKQQEQQQNQVEDKNQDSKNWMKNTFKRFM